MKLLVRTILKIFGKELRNVDSPTRSFDSGLNILSQHIKPKSVIDIGVAEGTPELYKHFPATKYSYLLIEADPHYRNNLEELGKQLQAKTVSVFCGSEHGSIKLRQYTDHRKSSRFETVRNNTLEEEITVSTETLDTLVAEHVITGPYVLKIDAEGAELDILRGAPQTINDCEAIIVEASVLPRFKGGPEFTDLIHFLTPYGFVVFDILAGVNNSSSLLSQVDVIFVRKDASFRQIDQI